VCGFFSVQYNESLTYAPPLSMDEDALYIFAPSPPPSVRRSLLLETLCGSGCLAPFANLTTKAAYAGISNVAITASFSSAYANYAAQQPAIAWGICKVINSNLNATATSRGVPLRPEELCNYRTVTVNYQFADIIVKQSVIYLGA